MAQAGLRIALADVWPEIVPLIPRDDRHDAQQALTVPGLRARDQPLGDLLTAVPTAFDFIIVNGIVLKQTRYAGRQAVELHGLGDMLAPPLTPSRQIESPAISGYRAHGEVLLAVVDLDLTHDLIGQMIASRRPTVSIALERLNETGQITRTDSGDWKIDPAALVQ